MKRWTILLFTLMMIFPGPAAVPARQAEPTATVLITPFRFYSAEDVAFLNHGILEMLATRLPKQGRIRVKQGSKAPVDDAEALVWAQEQKADYVLMGSVVIFGRSVSTDARMLKAASGAQALLYSRFGQTPGDVLRHVDLLAKEIAAAIAPKTAAAPKKRMPATK
ncbi:MAG: hypothetical protein PVH87_16380 [Desulfobacteraceae bacterium]|jgi:TolB-like protein